MSVTAAARTPLRSTLPARSHLDWLESEAIFILREVAGECGNPVLLFSGGKDSAVLLRLAEKAFRPGRFPFPLLHVDTGHNFPEVLAFRDRRVEELQVRFRTVGDIPCTCPVESPAATLGEIIVETASTWVSERGATRMDDQTSEASMERRKKEGYF